ncbi:MAG: hypothetical protein LBH32_12860 [Dysgonamonadaceae bacterium]|nr:hypothetical protein [Dysgonamonadaceae bacterium]
MVIRFYYMNGLLLKTGSHKGKDFEIIDKELVDEYSKYPNMYNHKYNWGTFLIEGNNYLMESLVEDPSGVRLCIYRESGYIENDTTIHTIESYYSGKNETKQIDELWHFRQFVHKPDSTNNFIK